MKILSKNSIEKYITKSFVVEALKFDGTNTEDLIEFVPELKDQELPKDVWVIKDSQNRFYISTDENFHNGFDKLTS